MAVKPKKEMTGNNLAEDINLWSIAGEIGVKLALPLVVFMLTGIQLDRYFQTTPRFMFVGILLAFSSSAYLVYTIIKRVNREPK